jgi:hypothetical protein
LFWICRILNDFGSNMGWWNTFRKGRILSNRRIWISFDQMSLLIINDSNNGQLTFILLLCLMIFVFFLTKLRKKSWFSGIILSLFSYWVVHFWEKWSCSVFGFSDLTELVLVYVLCKLPSKYLKRLITHGEWVIHNKNRESN